MLSSLMLAALASAPAHADSEILFKAGGPVLLFVDGEQADITSNLKMRASALEPGPHDVRVQGVFGKTLFEGVVDLDDWTRAHAEWQRGKFVVVRTETIDHVEEVAEVEEPEEPEEPEEVEVPEVEEIAEVEEPQEIEEPEEVAAPEPPPQVQIVAIEEEPPLAVPVEEPTAAAMTLPPEPPTPAGPRTLRVEATDGLVIELQHEGSTLFLIVEEGMIKVVDDTGVTVTFGEPSPSMAPAAVGGLEGGPGGDAG